MFVFGGFSIRSVEIGEISSPSRWVNHSKPSEVAEPARFHHPNLPDTFFPPIFLQVQKILGFYEEITHLSRKYGGGSLLGDWVSFRVLWRIVQEASYKCGVAICRNYLECYKKRPQIQLGTQKSHIMKRFLFWSRILVELLLQTASLKCFILGPRREMPLLISAPLGSYDNTYFRGNCQAWWDTVFFLVATELHRFNSQLLQHLGQFACLSRCWNISTSATPRLKFQ